MIFPNFQVRFSHSDQAQFIRTLIDARALAIQCARAQRGDSELRRDCERLHRVIDAITSELSGRAFPEG